MKQLLIFICLSIVLSSCLKESITDAMLQSQNSNGSNGYIANAASMSYWVNGVNVKAVVNNPDSQSPNSYQLGCTKLYNTQYYHYYLAFETGDEFLFLFYTDSLKVGHYTSTINPQSPFLTFNNTARYDAYTSDSLCLNITSYSNGHISGNFSGRLTPLVSQQSTATGYANIYGTPGSTLITNGTFKNIPVFY